MRSTSRITKPPRRRARRTLAVGLTATLAVGVLAACSDDSDEGGSGGGGDGEKITLSVGLFGSIEYEKAGLYAEYQRLHPNIKIEQTSPQENEDYITTLRQRLTQNSGLADIQAIEVGNIAEMTTELADAWVDFNEYDVDTEHFYDWKVAQATTEDGRVIGLGYDIGPMAICYRTDKFEEAGLPTNREEVSQLWAGSWEEYLNVGDEFVANIGDGTSYMDSAGGMFNAVVSGFEERYYNAAGDMIYDESPAVQEAWDLSARVATTEGMSAKQDQFTTEWNRSFANGAFATIACPAWMLGYIEGQAGADAEGLWDVAAAPQAANWGGSFIGVPQSAKHKEEAIELAKWLSAPEQQAKIFTERNAFPSSDTAAQLDEVQNATSEWFNGAPVGQIFSESASNIPASTIGIHDFTIQSAFTGGLVQVEQQGADPDDAFQGVVDELDSDLAE